MRYSRPLRQVSRCSIALSTGLTARGSGDYYGLRMASQGSIAMKAINTVLGTISPEQLGITLMHEHLLIGWAGWELDTTAPRFDRKTALRNCLDRLKETRDLGLKSMVDPCPMDIGRDIIFMAEAAQASGINII